MPTKIYPNQLVQWLCASKIREIGKLEAVAGRANCRVNNQTGLRQAIREHNFVRAECPRILIEGNKIKRITDTNRIIFGKT